MLFVFFNNIPELYSISKEKLTNQEIQFLNTFNQLNNDENIGYYRNHDFNPNYRESLGVPLEKAAFFISSGHFAPYWLSVFHTPINNQKVSKYDDDRKTSQLNNYFIENKINMTNEHDIGTGIINFSINKNIRYIIIDRNTKIPNFIVPYIIEYNEFRQYKILKCNFTDKIKKV